MSYILILLSVFHLFAEDAFLREVRKKPVKVQAMAMEARLEFAQKRGLDLGIEETLSSYIQLQIAPARKVASLSKLLGVKPEPKPDFRNLVREAVITEANRELVFSGAKEFASVPDSITRQKVLDFIVRHVERDDIDWVLAHEDFLKKALIEVSKMGDSFVVRPLQKAQMFGFLAISKQILEAHKNLVGQDLWVSFYHCNDKYLRNQLDQALDCYGKKPDSDWFQLGALYVQYLKGEFNQPEKERYLKLKEKMSSQTVREVFVLYDLLFLGISTGLVDSYVKTLKVKESYWMTFCLLSLDSKRSFLSPTQRATMRDQHAAAFPNSLLSGILTGKKTSESLIGRLSSNSLTVQILQ